MASAGNQPQSYPDMIQQLESKLQQLGPGPHTDAQREEIKALKLMLENARQESMKGQVGQMNAQIFQAPSQQQSHLIPQQQALRLPKSEPQTSAHDIKPSSSASAHNILDRKRLQALIKEVDPMTQVEDDVEEVLLEIADDFIDNVVNASCDLAKHRNSDTLDVKDVQFYLEKSWNMYVPGFGSDDLKPYKKPPTTEAHKQRLALIKKAMKKY